MVPLTFAPVGRGAALAGGIVATAQFDDIPLAVFHDLGAGDVVSITQAHLAAGRQAKEFLRRRLQKVVFFDVDYPGEGQLTGSHLGPLRVIVGLDLLDPVLGIVLDHHTKRIQHCHDARGVLVQILADAVFQHAHLDEGVLFGDADALAEGTYGLRGVAAPAYAGDRRHARVVPALHVFLLDQLLELALAHHGIFELQARELDLPGMTWRIQYIEKPVVEQPVILELQGAERVGDLFDGVRDAMGVIVHGVDTPLVSGLVVAGVADAVDDGIAHIQIGRCHVDLGAQHVAAVGKLAGAHAPEDVEILFHTTVAVGAFLARLFQGAAVLPNLFRAEAVHVGLAGLDQLNCVVVELVEIIRGVAQ